MRLLLKVFAGALVLAVVVAGAAIYYLDNIIREAVVRVGPEITGTPVELESVDVSLLDGSAALSGLAIGNPAGYQQPFIFSLDTVAVSLDLQSLNRDVILIHRIYVDSPEIFYEGTREGDNFRTLLDNIAANLPEPVEKTESETPAKKLIIDEFVFAGGLVSARHELMPDRTVDITLPELVLKDIGRKSNGATAQEAATQILRQITQLATQALGESAALEAARERAEELKQGARQKLDDTKAEAEAKVEEKLKEKGLNEEQQEALKGLINNFGQ